MRKKVYSFLFFALWLIALTLVDTWLIWQAIYYWQMDRTVSHWLLLFAGLFSGIITLLGGFIYVERKHGRGKCGK